VKEGKGFTNQVNHIKAVHKEAWQEKLEKYENEFQKKQASNGNGTIKDDQNDSIVAAKNSSLLHFKIPTKVQDIFFWIEWICLGLLPFSFVESDLNRKKAKRNKISVNTLKKFMTILCTYVEKLIRADLPMKMNLIIDGWTSGSTHYLSVFASYNFKEDVRLVMLAFSPLLDESKLDSREIVAFLEATLELYGKDPTNVVALTADNTNVNPATATLLGCHFVGCAAHKLNLAVNNYLQQHETLLSKLNDLMQRLLNLKAGGKLRQRTLLRPKLRCKTRWSGAFEMIERYTKLRPHLTPADILWADVLPSAMDDVTLDSLLAALSKINEASTQLQKHKLDLADARFILDDVISKHDNSESFYFNEKCGEDSELQRDKHFQSGCIKLLLGDDDNPLNDQERQAVHTLRMEEDDEVEEIFPADATLPTVPDPNLASRLDEFKKKRRRRKES
jgi:hypothetical protein